MSNHNHMSLSPKISTVGILSQIPLFRRLVRDIYRGKSNYFTTPVLVLPFLLLMWIRRTFYLSTESLSGAKNILVIKLDGIGDVVLLSAFLRELRANSPQAEVTLLVSPEAYNIVENCPYIDQVKVFDYQKFQSAGTLSRLRCLYGLSRVGIMKKYDLLFVPRWGCLMRSEHLISLFSGARQSVAFSERCSRAKSIADKGIDRFFTNSIVDTGLKHEVIRNFGLLRHLGSRGLDKKIEIWLNNQDISFAKKALGREDQSRAVICLGASEARRRWPVENYVHIARWLIRHYSIDILLVGSKQDLRAADYFQNNVRGEVINMVGRATLRQSAAMISLCRFYLGNDTGPMHIASAAGIPVFEISDNLDNPADPYRATTRRYQPFGVLHEIIQPKKLLFPCKDYCRFDGPHCINLITVRQVKQNIAKNINYFLEYRPHEGNDQSK